MKEFIAAECAKVFSKAINRFKRDDEFTSLCFKLIEGEPHYFLYIGGQEVQELTIEQLLNIKFIDLKQYSVILPPQIQAILSDFEAKHNHAVDVLVVMDEEDEVRYFLYLSDSENPTLIGEFNLVDVLKI